MAKAKDILTSSLRLVGQVTSLKIATDDDYELALAKLNQLLERWRELGLTLNNSIQQIDNINADVNYPTWAIEGIEYNLAKNIWPFFNLSKPISPNILEMADITADEIWNLGRPENNTVFPGNLPIGSGNESYKTRKFYPDLDKNLYENIDNQIDSETGNPLITE